MSYDVYYATGGSTFVGGGADIWVNYWLDEMLSFWVADPNLSLEATFSRSEHIDQSPPLFNLFLKKYFHGKMYPAKEKDWSKEYLSPIVSVKCVKSFSEAIDHINKYGTIIKFMCIDQALILPKSKPGESNV